MAVKQYALSVLATSTSVDLTSIIIGLPFCEVNVFLDSAFGIFTDVFSNLHHSVTAVNTRHQRCYASR